MRQYNCNCFILRSEKLQPFIRLTPEVSVAIYDSSYRGADGLTAY